MKELIYKESALKVLDDYKTDMVEGIPNAYSMARKRMAGLMPKRGEWKIEETESVWGKGYMLTCSECGDTFRVTENALSHEHFCRNCGADMSEGVSK